VNYRADPQNLRKNANVNCHTSLREELTKQLPQKPGEKKNIAQTPGETMTKLLLKYQHQVCML
jgi:hypothetical protein